MTIWEAVFGAQSADENDAFDKAYPHPTTGNALLDRLKSGEITTLDGETEEQKQERLWKAIQEMSRG